MNKSPLRYPGGKTRACKVLTDIFDEHFNHDDFTKIISPFCGGMSFEFHMQSKLGVPIVANDKFKPLVSFWQTAKEEPDKLCRRLGRKLGRVDKDMFAYCREQIMTTSKRVTQAIMYFMINRCSFSGATLSGGFSKASSSGRFTKSSIDRIAKLDLSEVDFHSLDYSDFIEAHWDSSGFMFIDPPYLLGKGSKLYGKSGDLHGSFDHMKLAEVLHGYSSWMMTYNDCSAIRELYSDCKIISVDWAYGMNKSKKSSEIVIIRL